MPGHRGIDMLHEQAVIMRQFTYPGQHVDDLPIRLLRVLCNSMRDALGFGERFSRLNQILHDAQILAFGSRYDASGQHHVRHRSVPDDLLDTDRAAAPQEDASLPFWQREESRRVRNSNVRRGCQFKASANRGAVQRCNKRNGAPINEVESGVPQVSFAPHRLRRNLADSVSQIRKIEASGESGSMPEYDTCGSLAMGTGHGVCQTLHQLQAQCISLFWTIQTNQGDRPVQFIRNEIVFHIVSKFGWVIKSQSIAIARVAQLTALNPEIFTASAQRLDSAW